MSTAGPEDCLLSKFHGMKHLFETNQKLLLTFSIAALLWLVGLWTYLIRQAVAWEYYVFINRLQIVPAGWGLCLVLLLSILLLFLPGLKHQVVLWGTLFTMALALMIQVFYWRWGNFDVVVPGWHMAPSFIDLVMRTYLWLPLVGAVLVIPTGVNLYILLKQRTVS